MIAAKSSRMLRLAVVRVLLLAEIESVYGDRTAFAAIHPLDATASR